MEIVLWIIGAWLTVGTIVTWATWQPEQDGWLWAVMLWPAQLASRYL